MTSTEMTISTRDVWVYEGKRLRRKGAGQVFMRAFAALANECIPDGITPHAFWYEHTLPETCFPDADAPVNDWLQAIDCVRENHVLAVIRYDEMDGQSWTDDFSMQAEPEIADEQLGEETILAAYGRETLTYIAMNFWTSQQDDEGSYDTAVSGLMGADSDDTPWLNRKRATHTHLDVGPEPKRIETAVAECPIYRWMSAEQAQQVLEDEMRWLATQLRVERALI